jgi:hypothetical protein
MFVNAYMPHSGLTWIGTHCTLSIGIAIVLAMIGSGGGVAAGYELKAREAPPPICVEQKNLTGF